ncbi:MAG: hypothetical protein IIU11_03405 [Bacteroidales bacterium]|jgi:transcriptional regulator of arginine metabolism|nr:hypothetical protein [Bacteroidales bacterium]MBR6279564.1 hypothetical protein [Bacteroidales bacterium]
MNNKKNRLIMLRQIIENDNIRSQKEILDILKERGVDLTQASLSRYLKEIQATRIPDGNGGYIYKLQNMTPTADIMVSSKLESLEFVGANFAVIKTSPGYANAVSIQIDQRQLSAIAGTVSGDDTILLIIRDGYSRKEIKNILIDEFPYLRDRIMND